MDAKKLGLGMLDTIVKVVFVIIVVMLISKYSKVAYNYGYHIFNQTAVSSGTGRTVSFTVGSGDSVATIAENLAGVGLITDKTLFTLQERFSEYHGMEQAGTYELSTSMTPEEMLTIMAGEGSETSEGESSESKATVYEGAETAETAEGAEGAEAVEGGDAQQTAAEGEGATEVTEGD